MSLKFFPFLVNLSSIIALAILLKYFGVGFDITDEAFYLLSALSPLSDGSITNFGFYTGALFRIFDFDLYMFRFAGGTILFLSYYFMFYFVCISLIGNSPKLLKIATDGLFICLPAVLYFYHDWILTPSYNWLALVGLAFFVGTLTITIKLLNKSRRYENTSICFLAFLTASWAILVFAGKPSTAFIVALFYPTSFFFFNDKWKWVKFSSAFVCLSFLLLLFHIQIFFGDISIFQQHLENGFEYGRILESGHTFSNRLGNFFLSFLLFPLFTIKYFVFSLIVLITIPIIKSASLHNKKYRSFFAFLLILFPLVVMSEFIFIHHRGLDNGPIIVSFSTLLIIYFEIYNSKDDHHYFGNSAFRVSCFCFIVLLFSIAFGFGSASGALAAGNTAAITASLGIYIYCNLISLKSKNFKNYVPLTLFNFSLVAAFLLGTFNPYRLSSNIYEQKYSIRTLSQPINLIVDRPTYDYLRKLRDLSEEYNWKNGYELIDLTGASPGATLFLAGSFVSKPWILGGYEGSSNFANRVLSSSSPEERNVSWFLSTSDGTRAIPIDDLNTEKFNFPSDYEILGSIHYNRRNETQFLWRLKQDRTHQN